MILGSNLCGGERVFSFSNGYQGSFSEVKQPEREVDHSAPSGTEVKKEWNYISPPPIHLHGVDRANFIFNHFFFFGITL